MRVVQLSNTNNWELLYNTNISAVQLPKVSGGFKLVPIPPIIPPLIIESYVLAVNIVTDVPENAVWRFGGNVYQKISTGLVLGGSQDAATTRRRAIFLDQVNLILFDRISSPYSLVINVPKWFPRANISIWQYTGEDTTDEKVFLQEEFGNVNFKLDQIRDLLI